MRGGCHNSFENLLTILQTSLQMHKNYKNNKGKIATKEYTQNENAFGLKLTLNGFLLLIQTFLSAGLFLILAGSTDGALLFVLGLVPVMFSIAMIIGFFWDVFWTL